MKLHEKIYQHRKQMGWSQEELAERVGVTRQAVSKWELGSSLPELEVIVSLAKVFGVTTDYLLSSEEPAEQASSIRQPDWLDRLPGFLGRMFRQYGWLLGVYIAVAGALFTGFGVLVRFMAKWFTTTAGGMLQEFENTSSGMFQGFPGLSDPLSGMQQQMNIMVANDPFLIVGTGVLIFGLILLVGGIILAVFLKKRGK